jgi:hypothetical protein
MVTHNSPLIGEGDEYASMSAAELAGVVAANRWTYAKTMPQCPHEYIVRKNVADDTVFCRFVMTIRRHGNDEPYFSKTHRYLDLGGFKYWTMGDWLPTTIIINRARITHAARPFVLNPTPFVARVNLQFPINRVEIPQDGGKGKALG